MTRYVALLDTSCTFSTVIPTAPLHQLARTPMNSRCLLPAVYVSICVCVQASAETRFGLVRVAALDLLDAVVRQADCSEHSASIVAVLQTVARSGDSRVAERAGRLMRTMPQEFAGARGRQRVAVADQRGPGGAVLACVLFEFCLVLLLLSVRVFFGAATTWARDRPFS